MTASGMVNARGESALPLGIQDLSAGADLVELSEEATAKLQSIVSELEDGAIKAKYKLEVTFGDDRSMHKPFFGIVAVWTNGGFANGGGDEAVYFCPNEVEKGGDKKYCGEPIHLAFIGRDVALCPACKRPVKPSELAGQVGYRLSVQGWAGVLVRVFARLGSNADLRIGYFPGDLRRENETANDKRRPATNIDRRRLQRQWAIYSLRNIIKDTSAGSQLQNCFKAFLMS